MILTELAGQFRTADGLVLQSGGNSGASDVPAARLARSRGKRVLAGAAFKIWLLLVCTIGGLRTERWWKSDFVSKKGTPFEPSAMAEFRFAEPPTRPSECHAGGLRGFVLQVGPCLG
jgi:hypothetical protein